LLDSANIYIKYYLPNKISTKAKYLTIEECRDDWVDYFSDFEDLGLQRGLSILRIGLSTYFQDMDDTNNVTIMDMVNANNRLILCML